MCDLEKKLPQESISNLGWNQFGTEYDFGEFSGSPHVYLLASTGRSGSHFLGSLLFETGQLGSPLEYLHPKHMARWQSQLGTSGNVETLTALFRRRTSPTGWFGLKAHWPQFSPFISDEPMFEKLAIKKYIYIERRDKIAQAISMVIAQQSNSWISFQKPTCEVSYDFEAINKAMSALVAQETEWEKFFNDSRISPLRIIYEDLQQEPHENMQKIRDFFGLTTNNANRNVKHRPKQQATDTNIIWKKQFLQDRRSKSEKTRGSYT